MAPGHDRSAVLERDRHDLGLKAGGQAQLVAEGAAHEFPGRHSRTDRPAHQRRAGIFGAVDFAITAIVEPLVGDDPVDVRVGAREQRRVARAGYRGRVVVPAIHEIGPAQQQVEASSDKVGPEALQVIVAKLVDHENQQQLRPVNVRDPHRVLFGRRSRKALQDQNTRQG